MATVKYSVQDGQKFQGCANLTVVTCATCFMTYAIPTGLYNAAHEWTGDRRDGKGWKLSCPVGHNWWYLGNETAGERAIRLLKDERDRGARLRADLDQAKASLTGERAAKTRFKNQRDAMMRKFEDGQCPCCELHFSNVREHMKHKHPGALAELEADQ